MEISESRTIGVVVERRLTGNVWQPERWSAVAVLPGRPDVAPWTVLDEGEGWTRRYAGAAEVVLFASETDNYKHNLDGPQPAIFVILRHDGSAEPGLRLLGATVDPGEIDAHSDAGDDLIEALPLPPDLAAWMQDFVQRHHVERPFHKRRRDRADPEALARRPRMEDDHG
jgi:hypothetical protein